MKMISRFCCALLVFCVTSFFIGCDKFCSDCDSGSLKKFYYLVNKTNNLLYESYDKDSLLFDTILLPNDTLFLFSHEIIPPVERYDAPTYFIRNKEVIIKDKNQTVLFYRSETKNCGKEDFVFGGKNSYYWIVDSTYIAYESCNMSWEDFEREYLNAE